MEPGSLIVAARFAPPDALRQFEEWRAEHQLLLDGLEPDQMRVDVGRAVGGDFVRVWLPAATAALLRPEGDPQL